jgi:hypothetical protein
MNGVDEWDSPDCGCVPDSRREALDIVSVNNVRFDVIQDARKFPGRRSVPGIPEVPNQLIELRLSAL